MNKTKILSWTVVLLILLNLSTLGTILYHNYQEKTQMESIVIGQENQTRLNGRFFRHELGFDSEQMAVFRMANQQFQPRVSIIIAQLDSLKIESYQQLNSEAPDTLQMNLLSEQIGTLHSELKKETNRFYMTIKSVCDESQAEQLKEAFTPLFRDASCEGENPGRRGRGYGKENNIN